MKVLLSSPGAAKAASQAPLPGDDVPIELASTIPTADGDESHSARFADAFSSILGKRTRGAAPPILESKPTDRLAGKHAAAQRATAKAAKQASAERRVVRERGHVVATDRAQVEREVRLRKVATRGVVQLFNAIAEAQRPPDEAPRPDQERPAPRAEKELSRESFLGMLGETAPQQRGSAAAGGELAEEEATRSETGGWDALRDDFGMLETRKQDAIREFEQAEPDEEEQEMESESE